MWGVSTIGEPVIGYTLTEISRHISVSYLGMMIYQHSVRMRGN
jgi:hypothetical protein